MSDAGLSVSNHGAEATIWSHSLVLSQSDLAIARWSVIAGYSTRPGMYALYACSPSSCTLSYLKATLSPVHFVHDPRS